MKPRGHLLICAISLSMMGFISLYGEDHGTILFDGARYERAFRSAERSFGSGDTALTWLEAARDGMNSSVARWEHEAIAMYAESGSFEAAKASLILWTEENAAARFGIWLKDRFFGREAALLRSMVGKGVSDANRTYLFVADDEGRLLHDEAGDAMYARDIEGFAGDESGWRADAQGSMDAALAGYDAWLEGQRSELLAYIPEGERKRYELIVADACVTSRNQVKMELDWLVAREARLFVARRTSDVWSLRKKSDSESASVIAASLVRDTGAVCDEGIAALTARIDAVEAAMSSGIDTDDLSAAGTEWLAAFEVQFSRGLASWKAAEERFMVRRLEWERDAGASYESGNAAWAHACEQLSAERRAWEYKAGALLQEGETAFAQAGETLEKNIASAMSELKSNASMRSEASADRASAWVGVYLESGNAAAGMREGLAYWLALLGPGVPGIGSGDLKSFLVDESLKNGVSEERLEKLSQALSSLDLYEEYGAKAADARARLAELCTLELGSGEAGLSAVLDEGASSEDFHLDEYQVALLRAQAVEGYWRKRVGIATAVLSYAQDISARRATEGEQLARLATTEVAYEAALSSYDEAVDALTELGSGIAESRLAMDAAQSALASAQEMLSEKQEEYALIMGELAAGDDGAFIRDELYGCYSRLVEASGISTLDGAPSETNLLANYLTAALRLGYAEDMERTGEALRAAVQGSGVDSSLADLAASASAVKVPLAYEDGVLSNGEYGISESDMGHALMDTLRAAMETDLGATVNAEIKLAVKARYGQLAARVAESVKSRAGAALASRMAGIALLGAADAGEWYAELTGRSLDPETGLEEALEADVSASRLSLLRARLVLELEALGIVSGTGMLSEASESALSLAAFSTLDTESTCRAQGTLSSLLDFVDAHADDSAEVFAAAIAELCRLEPGAGLFLRGQGFFTVAGCDAGSVWCGKAYAEYESSRLLYEAYQRWRESSSAVDRIRLDKTRAVLAGQFSALGLTSSENLPQVKALGAAICRSTDPAGALSMLMEGLDEASSMAPAWLGRELASWKAVLVEYVAAKTLASEMPAPVSASNIAHQLAVERERIRLLGSVLDGLSGSGESYARALVVAAEAPAWTPTESALIFEETASYIAVMLAAGFGVVPDGPDWQEATASLEISANERYDFTGVELRSRSVAMAIEILKTSESSTQGIVPETFDNAGQEARLLAIVTAARRYAGVFSGSAISWAADAFAGTAYEGDSSMRLALARYLENGSLDVSPHEVLGLGVERSSASDTFRRWMFDRISNEVNAGIARSRNMSNLYAYAHTYETMANIALDAYANGVPHWREALGSQGLLLAIAEAEGDVQLAPPGSAGNPEGDLLDIPVLAASMAEGALADAYEEAVRSSTRLDAAFYAWNGSIVDRVDVDSEAGGCLADFRVKASAYIDDPARVFDPYDVSHPAEDLAEAYLSKHAEYSMLVVNRTEAHAAISRLAEVYAIVSSAGMIQTRLLALEDELKAAGFEQNVAMAAYNDAATSFNTAGDLYDEAYDLTRQLHDGVEIARTAYETEEAIRSWAGTAYLACDGIEAAASGLVVPASYRSPGVELSYARSSLARAEAALTALSSLYDTDTTDRPYVNAAYDAAEEAYKDRYRRMMIAAKARDAVAGATTKEYQANDTAYKAYQDTMFGAGERASIASRVSYADYSTPTDVNEAGWKDMLSLRGGTLGLSYDASFNLSLLDGAEAASLESYFGTYSRQEGVEHPSTQYERDVLAWGDRVNTYLGADTSRFEVWANARDYLIGKLIKANPLYESLSCSLVHAEILAGTVGGKHYDGTTIAVKLDEYKSGTMVSQQEAAWNSLSAQEKADLEFYIVMGLTGGAESSSDAFRLASETAEYSYVSDEMQGHIDSKKNEAKGLAAIGGIYYALGVVLSWTPVGPVYIGMGMGFFVASGFAENEASDWQIAKTKFVDTTLGEDRALLASGQASLTAETWDIAKMYKTYEESCRRLATLKGVFEPGMGTDSALRDSLANAGMAGVEIEEIAEAYAAYLAAVPGETCLNTADAMHALVRWSKTERNESMAAIERIYDHDASAQVDAESEYRKVYERYIAGEVTDAVLAAAAESAYGVAAASKKQHLSRLTDAIQVVSMPMNPGELPVESAEAVWRFASLVERAAEARYTAELAARGAEWDSLRRDLADKRAAWREAGSIILSRGRVDFDRGFSTLRERAADWHARFQAEYEAKTTAWEYTYAGMLDDKLSWLAQATNAANEVGSETMLALVGADAAAAARHVDTKMVLRMDMETGAANAYMDAMNQSGIDGMLSALGSRMRSAGTIASAVRSGVGGMAAWDSGSIRVAAAEFAQTTAGSLSGIQARMLAFRVRELARMAVSGLSDSVRDANEGFGNSMNDMYVGSGKWHREGDSYVKDVVVHSTAANPYITERARVSAYTCYAMAAWNLATDLSDGALAGMGAGAIQALIRKAQDEVGKKGEEIFGNAFENSEGADIPESRKRIIEYYKDVQTPHTRTVTHYNRDGDGYEVEEIFFTTHKELDESRTVRETVGAGAFGAHIGYRAFIADNPDPGNGEAGVLQDPGSGELGRLMAKYLYWSVKEGMGWSEANKPVYEKDLWDDRGDWFQAPSIRGVADIGFGVAAVALSGGTALPALLGAGAINLADDVVFGALDVSGGYNGWEEAGMNLGKKILTGTVNAAAGQFFGGAFSSLEQLSGATRVAGKTVLTGMQAYTTNFVSGAINSIGFKYDENGAITGLGFDDDAFANGVFGEGAVAACAGGMAGAAIGSGVHYGSAYGNKLWSGFTNLGTMAAAEGAQYLTHMAYSAGRGLSGTALLNDAWAHHDITLNVANLGSIMDAAGFIAVVNSDGYSPIERASFNTAARALSAFGLDLSFSRQGITGTLGSSGYDLVDISMGIGKGLVLNKKLEEFAATQTMTANNAMKTLYSHGDFAGEETVWRLALGKDSLDLAAGTGKAQTTSDLSGNRILRLPEKGDGTEVMLDLAVSLQHESWRNGLDDGIAGQTVETYMATLAHTRMAVTLAQGDYGVAMTSLVGCDANYKMDIVNYLGSDFAAYVANTYESSGDFWKLMANGDLVDDGDGWLRDQNGNYVKDNDGNTIGAKGKETGLLNILYGGTTSADYNQYSDTQIDMVQRLMENSGMVHTGQVDKKARMWNGTTGSTIAANSISSGFGDSVATPVFMNGMDRATDIVLFSDNFNQVDRTMTAIPGLAESRFASYLKAKAGFYTGEHTLWKDTKGLSLSQIFQESIAYNGNQHRGGDIAGPSGTKILAGYGGKVVRNTKDHELSTSGHTLVIEYGFNFENSFYSTGIQAQYMHLAYKSPKIESQLVDADTIIGKMGNTGLVFPKPTDDNLLAGTHLHYQLMGNLPGYSATHPAWSMLDSRRNTFLAQVGTPSTGNYVHNQGTSVMNNYTGSAGNPTVDYFNYYYNPNEWLRRMGL